MLTKKIFGIDLGTTNSLIAYHDGSEVKIIADKKNQTNVPSVVSFLDNDTYVVGHAAKALQHVQANKTVFSIKRFMGKNPSDITEVDKQLPYEINSKNLLNVELKIGEKNYTPQEISSFILKELKNRAEKELSENVEDVVITVPAYFNDKQRAATQLAGKLAGLNVRKIINEPTAAALAYGLDKKLAETIAVYDFGGGTFDISILKLSNGIFEVLSTNGDTRLGGDDIDNVLIDYFAEKLGLSNERLHDLNLRDYLRYMAEQAKIKLSTNEAISLHFLYSICFIDQELHLDRIDFEQIILSILTKTKRCVKQALKDADLDFRDINEIVLVGGSTRIPLVRTQVSAWFGKQVHSALNPEEVVAIGAAIQGAIIAGQVNDTVLLDVTPLSLGLETAGGVVEKFIMRNTKIPCKVEQQFTTSVDGQRAVSIHILQGEREFAKDNISLGKFVLNNITSQAAGIPRITVRFELNANGVLNVTALDEATGVGKIIEVKPHQELSDEKVESLLMTAFANAKTDMEERLLTESRSSAKALILVTEKALSEHYYLLNTFQMRYLRDAIQNLNLALNKNLKRQDILLYTEQLEKQSEPFAELIMNSAIKKAMKNKHIDNILGESNDD